jgi:hypothetical protein
VENQPCETSIVKSRHRCPEITKAPFYAQLPLCGRLRTGACYRIGFGGIDASARQWRMHAPGKGLWLRFNIQIFRELFRSTDIVGVGIGVALLVPDIHQELDHLLDTFAAMFACNEVPMGDGSVVEFV